MQSSDQVGRRIKLHDLRVLTFVVQAESMSKAATLLNTTQSTISRSIADLEHALGVRLLDRSSQGVKATMYGDALLKRSIAVFDELEQSVRDIGFLADPAAGEIKVACSLVMALTIIPQVIDRFVKKYPRAVLHIDEVASGSGTRDFPELRDRKYDLVLTRGGALQADEQLSEDFNIEILFDDQLVIAAGSHSKWVTRRRKIELAELVNEPWIMQAPHTLNYRVWRRLSTCGTSPCQGRTW
jgi:DNA-binding transcriptional LysR family regulator